MDTQLHIYLAHLGLMNLNVTLGGLLDLPFVMFLQVLYLLFTILIYIWSAKFLGIHPQLNNPSQVHDTADRFKLVTESMGKVHLTIHVLTRNMRQHGIKL